MTPGARLQAAADILDRILATRAPAEAVLKSWGQANRYAGAKDRRAIADRVYRCLRARERLAWAMGEADGRALVIGSLALVDAMALDEIEALYSGEGYAPSRLEDGERERLRSGPGAPPAWVSAGLPEFVAADLAATFGPDWPAEAEALVAPRAPIDLRLAATADRGEVSAEVETAGLRPTATLMSARCLRLSAEPPPNIQKLSAFRRGRIEIQDEGSQIAAFLAGAKPGWTVVDYCAGGGGKTLVLAEAVGPGGRVIGCDVDPRRLANIRPRLARAGLSAELRELGEAGEGVEDLTAAADLVLVDAPCSGSGTWRRRPEDASRLTEAEVGRLHDLQRTVLERASALVRPGGRLAYVTCSGLRRENEDVVDAFERDQPEFEPAPVAQALAAAPLTTEGRERLALLAKGSHRLRLSPRLTNTDGFFVSLYERRA